VIESVECGADGGGDWFVCGGKPGTDDAAMHTAQEGGGAKAVIGDAVAMRLGYAFDQTVQSEPPQVVGHLASTVLLGRDAQERSDVLAQLAVGEALGK